MGPAHNRFGPQLTNLVWASFNVVGVRFDTLEQCAFSKSVVLNANRSGLVVRMWEGVERAGSGRRIQRQVAGQADVDGDGLLMVEILKDNARQEAGEVYGAMDMGSLSDNLPKHTENIWRRAPLWMQARCLRDTIL